MNNNCEILSAKEIEDRIKNSNIYFKTYQPSIRIANGYLIGGKSGRNPNETREFSSTLNKKEFERLKTVQDDYTQSENKPKSEESK